MEIELRKKSIGETLKAERAHKGLTLDEVQMATKIRKIFIKAIEQDDFSALPSPVVAKGFLRIYSEYLGLSKELLIEQFNQIKLEKESEKVLITNKIESTKPFFVPTPYLRLGVFLATIVVASVTIYFALSGYSR